MPAQFRPQKDGIRRNHARGHGLHDHFVRTADARRLQAEAIANGVHRVWTKARRALERLVNGKSREQRAAANGRQISQTLGRASVGDAIRRDRLGLARLVRRSVLEPYARMRRRRIAIAQLRTLNDHLLADIGLTRGQIELAVDGKIARRGETFSRPAGRGSSVEEVRHELPLAA